MEINKIYQGNCLEIMKDWPDNFIDCCITSPPYWGLRDYGVDGQFGLEETPVQYVDNMVKVFREVRRVLKPEGTLWLNLGDSYNVNKNGNTEINKNPKVSAASNHKKKQWDAIKTKDLVGIPWRTAFALQADGWWLRQDIIWHKPNPMPESVQDRCTKAHEYIFLMSKSARYYFDNEAIKEEATTKPIARDKSKENYQNSFSGGRFSDGTRVFGSDDMKKNKRSVWTVPTKPYKEAHFATYPEKLIETCVLAGCPEGGLILDPFMGSGTTAMVAYENRRNYIGCELNPEYIKLNRAEKSKDKYSLLEAI